jgi:hypothetical protein
LDATEEQDEQAGMKFSAVHLMPYCRSSTSKIPGLFACATSRSSSMVSALLTLDLTEPLEGPAGASSCSADVYTSLILLKVMPLVPV